MGRTRKSADDRKREIIDAAIRLAAEIGPDRVTTQQLADAVGLTQPAIFRHFPTKAGIWTAVGTEIVRRLDTGGPEFSRMRPGDRLRALVSRQLGFIARQPAITAILFSRELHAENDALRQHFEDMMRDRRQRFAELVRAEIEAGRFRADLNPDDAAALTLAAIQGLAMRWSMEQRRFDIVAEGERLIFAMIETWKVAD